MRGTVRLVSEGDAPRPLLLELTVDVPGALLPWHDVAAAAVGRVYVPGWADDPKACGTLRIAPLAARHIRYRLDFTTRDGRRIRLDGWKSIGFRHPYRSMTTLPATLTDQTGTVVGEASLRFASRDLAAFLGSFRYGLLAPPDGAQYLPARWRGAPGRLEVWYTTLTDPRTGAGAWIHHELVAPTDGGPPRAHGWAAVFPPGSSPAAPVLGRFGPHPWTTPRDGLVFAAGEVQMSATRLCGRAGPVSWNLTTSGGGAPLFTFPRWAWERELLPAAQIVPAPTLRVSGTLRYPGGELALRDASGATARIYGHGNAERWAWLHADLGGDDVLEIVAAVPPRPGLRRLPPLPFVRLRVDGRDWPAGDPLRAAARMRARIGFPTWTVSGRVGDRRIMVRVTQPRERTIAVDYTDPDGSPAVCRNSEVADALIRLERRGAGGRWEPERVWRLAGTAHAEVGGRD